MRGVTLCRLGRRDEGLPEVSRYATALRERLPRHRYLQLAQEAQPRQLALSVSAGRVGRRRVSPFIQVGRDRKGCPPRPDRPTRKTAHTCCRERNP
jgi:hypothetical protein